MLALTIALSLTLKRVKKFHGIHSPTLTLTLQTYFNSTNPDPNASKTEGLALVLSAVANAFTVDLLVVLSQGTGAENYEAAMTDSPDSYLTSDLRGCRRLVGRLLEGQRCL